jgi:hypothetical protein
MTSVKSTSEYGTLINPEEETAYSGSTALRCIASRQLERIGLSEEE